MRNRVRAFFTSDATNPPSILSGPQSTVQSISPLNSSSVSSITASNGGAPASVTLRSQVLEKALMSRLQKIPEAEKAAFLEASKTIDEHALLSDVQGYDLAHKNDSSFRPHAERLSKFLGLLNRFMGGVAIGIQANPEISALVVGAVRIVIDLALKFTTFFSRLTDMICKFEDYLGPLTVYTQSADISLVDKTVVNAYGNVLDFGWKVRCVFVQANGDRRKWTSLRAFLRQHWEPFESEFLSIKEDMQHHLDILLHSVQALHFDAFRKDQQERQRETESGCIPSTYLREYFTESF